MPRVVRFVVCFALSMLAPSAATAQLGGSGSIQGTVLDTSNAALPGATVTPRTWRRAIATVRQTTSAGVYTLSPLPPGEYRVTVTLARFPDVRSRITSSVDALSVIGLNVTLQVGGDHAGSARDGRVAAAGDGRRAARPDDPERGLHRAAAGDEHGRAARSDRVHVPDARRAVGRALGQRHGRPGLHRPTSTSRASRSRTPWCRARAATCRSASRSRRSISSRSRPAARPSCTTARARPTTCQVGHEPVPWQCLRVLPQQGAGRQGVLRDGQAGRQPARVRLHARRSASQESGVLLRRLRRLPRPPADRVAADLDSDARRSATAISARCRSYLRSATTRPNPNGTGFVRDPFPGNIIPQHRISPISRTCSPPCPIRRTATCRTTISEASCRSGSTTTTSRPKSTCELSSRHQIAVLYAHGKRSQATPYRGGTNSQTQLPLPYTETRLVEEIPTTAQVKHTS